MREVRPAAYDSKIEGNVIFTRLDAAMNWMRKNSLWPMPMGLACCAIELMATAAARFDISRFGAEVMRFPPRQCDVMIVAGTVTYKMALAVKRIYEQMPEPKWVIAMGACASTGGMYRSYAVLQGIVQTSLETEVPVLSAVLTPHHFHEHAAHVEFFKEHMQTKGKELAEACVSIVEKLAGLEETHHGAH